MNTNSSIPKLEKIGEGEEASLSKPLWLDADDAAQIASVARVSEEVRNAAVDLITRGVTVLPGAQDPEICSRVIQDYQEFCAKQPQMHAESLDAAGRERRLVNFHHYSEAAMQVGTNPQVMEVLDYIFGAEASVYTSLTFKYGTQQPVHRDTPHFATWPDGYFCGVWTALEDIDPDSGPLFYYEGAHRFSVNVEEIWNRVRAERSDLSNEDALLLALDIYNGQVIDSSADHGVHRTLEMKKGDVVIWHPQLPHGGSPANDPSKSRWSMVFHCAPVKKQVHQHQSFFENAGKQEPPPRYGFKEAFGRQIALAGDIAFQ